jgi:hypothetical protein
VWNIASICALFAWGAYANDDSFSLLQTSVERTLGEETNRPRHHSPMSHKRGATSSIVRLLDFTKATLIFNNLGGEGPDKYLPTGEPAPAQIRYRKLVHGQAVDLMIVSDPGYTAHNSKRNGILGGNGQINAKSGTAAGLTFTFVEEGTNNPHVMSEFYMTFSDIDERHGGMEKEKIVVDNFDKYYTNDDLQLEDPDYEANGHEPTFVSSDYGNYADNGLSPDSPDAVLLSHSVTYLFTNKASFHVEFTIEETRDFNKGRNVLFSGVSQLVFCKEPSTMLDFKNATVTVNNLGGKGPMVGVPDEIRYSGIATASDGTVLDLVATADEEYGYGPSNVSQNGRHGEFGIINLFCGPTKTASEVYVTSTIVESGTSTPFQLEAFAFTVFDFDMGLHEQQIEYVDMRPTTPGFDVVGTGYASYIVTKGTELDVSIVAKADDWSGHDLGWTRFSATKHGTESDNPSSSQMMAREVADKSVSFTYRKTSTFTMTLGITATGYNSGRNFMFAGQDMYLMCD